MQVKKLQKQTSEQVAKLKVQLKAYMSRHPLAAKYAKEPFLTWVLYGATAITVTSTWALGAAVLGKRCPLLIPEVMSENYLLRSAGPCLSRNLYEGSR